MSPVVHAARARRTWAEIDPVALIANLQAIRRAGGEKVGIIAVVKANAYGHGIAAVVPVLAPHVAMFAVANVSEARAVRLGAPETEILLLGPALPDERPEIIAHGFIPLI